MDAENTPMTPAERRRWLESLQESLPYKTEVVEPTGLERYAMRVERGDYD